MRRYEVVLWVNEEGSITTWAATLAQGLQKLEKLWKSANAKGWKIHSGWVVKDGG